MPYGLPSDSDKLDVVVPTLSLGPQKPSNMFLILSQFDSGKAAWMKSTFKTPRFLESFTGTRLAATPRRVGSVDESLSFVGSEMG